MTTLTTPTLQSLLVRTVGEALANNPNQLGETIRLGAGVVREVRESVARMRQELEEGSNARSFARSYGPIVPDADEYLVQLGSLLEELSDADGTAAELFIAELRLLKKEAEAFRNRLAEALSLAAESPRPLDWDRLKSESDADFAAGRFTTFETSEAMRKGLAGDD